MRRFKTFGLLALLSLSTVACGKKAAEPTQVSAVELIADENDITAVHTAHLEEMRALGLPAFVSDGFAVTEVDTLNTNVRLGEMDDADFQRVLASLDKVIVVSENYLKKYGRGPISVGGNRREMQEKELYQRRLKALKEFRAALPDARAYARKNLPALREGQAAANVPKPELPKPGLQPVNPALTPLLSDDELFARKADTLHVQAFDFKADREALNKVATVLLDQESKSLSDEQKEQLIKVRNELAKFYNRYAGYNALIEHTDTETENFIAYKDAIPGTKRSFADDLSALRAQIERLDTRLK